MKRKLITVLCIASLLVSCSGGKSGDKGSSDVSENDSVAATETTDESYAESQAKEPQQSHIAKEPASPSSKNVRNTGEKTNHNSAATKGNAEKNTTSSKGGIPATVYSARPSLPLSRGFGGDVSGLKEVSRMSVYVDFSSASIDGNSEKQFITYMATSVREKERDPEFSRNWRNVIKPNLVSLFIEKANEELSDKDIYLTLVKRQGEEYTLKVIVREINDNGDNECDYLIINTPTGKVVAQFDIDADGGHVGRYVGLLEDGFKEAGKKFGRSLARKIRRS